MRLKDKCSNCYFGDKCYCDNVCDDYSPIETTEDTEYLIECRRFEFLDEWNEYQSEYSD